CPVPKPITPTLRSFFLVFFGFATKVSLLVPDPPSRCDQRPTGLALPAGLRLLGSLAGARVGLGALAASRESATMAQAPVRSDVHEPLDAHADLGVERSFHAIVVLDLVAEQRALFFSESRNPRGGIELRRRENLLRGGAPDSEDVRERDVESLLVRQIDARYACQRKPPVPIRLFESGACPRLCSDSAYFAIVSYGFLVNHVSYIRELPEERGRSTRTVASTLALLVPRVLADHAD